jgi:adenylosuccinate lyase
MPHKRNPILNERISGIARVVRGYAVPALENVVLWHERDISNSSVERVILPDASTLVDYMLGLLTTIVDAMSVNEARMSRNLESSHGLFFSEKVLTRLIESGLSRPDAYAIVQRDAMESWKSGEAFRSIVERDDAVSTRLSRDDIDRAFDPAPFLEHIDSAFVRAGLESTLGE